MQTFAPGDGIESFTVPITNDAAWETMEHFTVKLTEVEAGEAAFGTVTSSVVYIVDDDTYPQNFEVPNDEVPDWTLMWGFIRERWRHRHPKPIKSMCCICYDSIHEVIATYVPVLIVTEVIEKKEMKYEFCGVLAAIFLASNAFNWWCEVKFMDWRGNSGTRKDLRNWLVMKYVYFSEAVHNTVDNTHFFDAAMNMVEETVSNGWFQHFKLVAAIFDLCLQLALAVYLDWHAVLPVALLLPVIWITVLCKQKKFVSLVKTRMHAEDAWMGQMGAIFSNWMLINAYNIRDDRAGTFKKTYEDFYKKHRKSRFFQLNYQWCTRYANEVCIAVIIVFGANECVNNGMSIGKYMALLKIFDRIGGRIVRISDILIAMQRGIEGLRRVSELLNNPMGVTEEMEMQKEQAKAAQKAFNVAMTTVSAATKFKKPLAKGGGGGGGGDRRQSAVQVANNNSASSIVATYLRARGGVSGSDEDVFGKFTGAWTSDMVEAALTIQFDNVHFEYPTNKGAKALVCDVPLLVGQMSFTLPLGHLVALLPEVHNGHRSGGEGLMTIMKLLTSQLYPTRGEVRIPPHLSTLLVHLEPMLLAEPLLKNLTLGNPKVDEAFAWKVAEALGMTKAVLGHGTMHCGNDGGSLRLADRQVVSLARALIADPHVLVISKPCASFGADHAKMVFATLLDWQKRRGLWAPAAGAPKNDQNTVLDSRSLVVSLTHSSLEHIPSEIEIIGQVNRDDSGASITLSENKNKNKGAAPMESDYDSQ